MGLFVEQNSNRTKLQERLAAELQEKARRKQKVEGDGGGDGSGKLPDGVDDSAYIEGTKQTTSLAAVWAVIFLFAVAILIAIIWGFNQSK